MARARRLFNPHVLDKLSHAPIKPSIGIGALVWRFTILVPIEETKPGRAPKLVATDEDLVNLEITLTNHFDGLTIPPDSVGYGLRGKQIEINTHTSFVVYAAASTPSDLYFQALRRELQNALVQEIILVERQEVWLH